MADDKKKADKKPDSGNWKVSEEIIFLLAGLFLLAILINRILAYIAGSDFGNFDTLWSYFLHSYFFPFWVKWKVFAVIVSACSLIWAIYSAYMLKEVAAREEAVYGPAPAEPFLEETGMKKNKDAEKWRRIVEQSNSINPSDWRLSIIEADVMLESILRNNGFPGETIGEMLKSAKPGDFITLDAAWEAHKVRNRIAHGGNEFQLSERDTRRAIALYEAVFKEFGII